MKKLLLFSVLLVGAAIAYTLDAAAGASLAFLAPIMINNVEVKDFAGFLTAKGVKDVSSDFESASDVEKQAYYRRF